MTVKIRQRTLRSGRTHWQADIHVTLPDGSVHRERRKAPVTSKRAALRWARAREAHLIRHGVGRGSVDDRDDTSGPRFAEFVPRFMADYVRANRLKPATVRRIESVCRNHLVPELGAVPLTRIGAPEIQRLKRRPMSVSTVNLVLRHLRTMLRTAARWGLIDAAPEIRKLREGTQTPAFYDFDEYLALTRAAAAEGPGALAAVRLAGDAGLRRGEIIALRWRDVNLARGSVTVATSEWRGHVGSPKGGRARTVPMTKQLRHALEALARQGPRVVVRVDGSSHSGSSIVRVLNRCQRRAGTPTTGMHILRHTFCSHLAMRGVAPRVIQELAGHASSATTDKYMHLSPGTLDLAIARLRPEDE